MATKKTAVKKAAKKKFAPKKKSAPKKRGKQIKTIKLLGDRFRGIMVRNDGGSHEFTIVGGSHVLMAPKDQKLGKVKVAKDGTDVSLTFEK